MRRLGLVLTMCGLFVASSPVPASAVSWWALEKLSGPKFKGPVVDTRLWCFPEPVKEPPPDPPPPPAPAAPAGEPEEPGSERGLMLSLCNLKPGERRRASIDVNVGWFHSQSDEQFAAGKEIKLIMLESSFSAHAWGPVEVGVAVGMSWFSSEGLESFRKFTIEPLRIDLRPLQWNEARRRERDLWGEAIVVRVGWVAFPEGFEAAEFKYKRIPGEAVGYIGFFLDAEPLLLKLRKLK